MTRDLDGGTIHAQSLPIHTISEGARAAKLACFTAVVFFGGGLVLNMPTKQLIFTYIF